MPFTAQFVSNGHAWPELVILTIPRSDAESHCATPSTSQEGSRRFHSFASEADSLFTSCWPQLYKHEATKFSSGCMARIHYERIDCHEGDRVKLGSNWDNGYLGDVAALGCEITVMNASRRQWTHVPCRGNLRLLGSSTVRRSRETHDVTCIGTAPFCLTVEAAKPSTSRA